MYLHAHTSHTCASVCVCVCVCGSQPRRGVATSTGRIHRGGTQRGLTLLDLITEPHLEETSSEALIYLCIATRKVDPETFCLPLTTLNHLSYIYISYYYKLFLLYHIKNNKVIFYFLPLSLSFSRGFDLFSIF